MLIDIILAAVLTALVCAVAVQRWLLSVMGRDIRALQNRPSQMPVSAPPLSPVARQIVRQSQDERADASDDGELGAGVDAVAQREWRETLASEFGLFAGFEDVAYVEPRVGSAIGDDDDEDGAGGRGDMYG